VLCGIALHEPAPLLCRSRTRVPNQLGTYKRSYVELATASLSRNDSIPGRWPLNKKRKLFPGPRPASPREWKRYRHNRTPNGRLKPLERPSLLRPGAGILTRFPFGPRKRIFFFSHTPVKGRSSFFKFFSITTLGSTDPWPTAVPMEAFSTSVLQGLTGVFATTTKICTDDGSGQAHAFLVYPFAAHRLAFLHDTLIVCVCRPGIGITLERHPFSGLVASAGELLHTP